MTRSLLGKIIHDDILSYGESSSMLTCSLKQKINHDDTLSLGLIIHDDTEASVSSWQASSKRPGVIMAKLFSKDRVPTWVIRPQWAVTLTKVPLEGEGVIMDEHLTEDARLCISTHLCLSLRDARNAQTSLSSDPRWSTLATLLTKFL